MNIIGVDSLQDTKEITISIKSIDKYGDDFRFSTPIDEIQQRIRPRILQHPNEEDIYFVDLLSNYLNPEELWRVVQISCNEYYQITDFLSSPLPTFSKPNYNKMPEPVEPRKIVNSIMELEIL